MADTEFEEFRYYFERLPQHLKAPVSNYTLVHDIILDDSPTLSQDSDVEVNGNNCDVNADEDSEDDEVVVLHRHETQSNHSSGDDSEDCEQLCCSSIVADSNFSGGRDSGIGDFKGSSSSLSSWATPEHRSSQKSANSSSQNNSERRRRRLPEIPKNKKSFPNQKSSPSLAEELDAAAAVAAAEAAGSIGRPHFIFRKYHSSLRHEDSSPDSERMATDSGHSTAHSPDNGPKSVSPLPCESLQIIGSPESISGIPFTQLELLEATHRGLHKFIPRHKDEINLEIGDPIYIQKEADDLWCEGVNLRTGKQGIFPSAYVVDLDYTDFDPTAPKVKKERYLLGYLGSVETLSHKGTSVVCQAVKRIVGKSSNITPVSQRCILEVSDQGLRMVDRSKSKKIQGPCHDYFYSLKNVSFCAFHPHDHRYLGFITKHPTLQRFACHVFVGQESTRPVAEAVGRAFHRFYTKFIETAFPTEDIYIE